MFKRVGSSLAIALLIAVAVFGGTATRKTFFSQAMGQEITYFLYQPSNYDQKVAQGEKFSVIYLMHWWAYKADGWHAADPARINPRLDQCIDSVSNIICVAPQDPTNTMFGPFGTGWWVNSSVGNLGDLISKDMVAEVEANYQVYNDRGRRGVCGPSMGGFGTLHHIRMNSDIFRVGYAIVPATDLRNYQIGKPMSCSWGLCNVFTGAMWSTHNPMENISEFKSKDIIIHTQSGDCSRNCPSTVIPDFFYQENLQFAQAMGNAPNFKFHDMPETGHDYPSPQNMVAILRFFEQHFNNAQSVLPESKATAKRSTIVNKAAKLNVEMLKNGSLEHGSFAAIDGRPLKAVPKTGVIIRTK